MKAKIQLLLFILLGFPFTVLGQQSLTFNIEVTKSLIFSLSSVKLTWNEPITILNKKLSKGSNKINVAVNERGFYLLKIGEISTEVYLEPNQNYQINEKLSFINNGNMNNLIQSIHAVFTKTSYNNMLYYQWEGDTLVNGVSLVRTKVDSIVATNLKKLTTKEADILNTYSIYLLKGFILNKYWSRYNPAKPNAPKVPKFFQNEFNEFKIDAEILELNSYSYKSCLNYYSNIIGTSITKDLFSRNIIDMNLLLDTLYNQINTHDYPIKIKEYMLANLLNDFLMTPPPSKFINKLHFFNSVYPQSKYYSIILERFNKYQTITNSGSAPYPLFAHSPFSDEKIDILEKYLNSILYIDFWATWCGPCVKELPNLSKLNTHYIKNNDIKIIKTSIDINESIWQDFERKYEEKHLISFRLNDQERDNILNKYALVSVPRYMIVSKNGKILDANAPSPSEPKLIEILDKLLKEQ